jgi:hypothetical protein
LPRPRPILIETRQDRALSSPNLVAKSELVGNKTVAVNLRRASLQPSLKFHKTVDVNRCRASLQPSLKFNKPSPRFAEIQQTFAAPRCNLR